MIAVFVPGITLATYCNMKKEKHNRAPYITDEEFNRIVAKRRIPEPSSDSKGDSASDQLMEIEMGENYPEEDVMEEVLDEVEEVEAEDEPRKKAS